MSRLQGLESNKLVGRTDQDQFKRAHRAFGKLSVGQSLSRSNENPYLFLVLPLNLCRILAKGGENEDGSKEAHTMAKSATNVGHILDRLSEVSSRPRYAFAVLNLLAEQAGPGSKVGPFIQDEDEVLPLRVWIGKRLSRISGRNQRRKKIEQRIRQELADELPQDLFEAQRVVDAAVEEHVRGTGADNFSRVVTELEKAGYVARFYEGYRTNHVNRGGLRNLVCVIDADVSAALRRRDVLI